MDVDRTKLHADLLAVFKAHGVSVAVGITSTGVAIRSQDKRVDAASIGRVEPYAEAREGDAVVIHLEPDADTELVNSQLREALDGTGIRSVLVSADVATSVTVARGRG